MTGYTNNFIVEDVARNYKIDNLIKSMIDYSFKDGSCDDLYQYIMLYLLTYDNIRLNQMYNDNKLRPFISQIILKQRDGGVGGRNTIYVNYFKISNINQTDSNSMQEEDTYNYMVDIILDYIDKNTEFFETGLETSEQLKRILAFTILKKYFLSDLTQHRLAKSLGLSRSTIASFLKFAKEDVYNFWITKGQYLDENDYLKNV